MDILIGILIVVAAGLGLTIAIQSRSAANTYRPLSSRQPRAQAASTERPLGTEAIDLEAVKKVVRQNEALERAHVNWTRGRRTFMTDTAETHIDPWEDDET